MLVLLSKSMMATHLIFDVKLDENFQRNFIGKFALKVHYVADGHQMETPTSMTYSIY